MVVYKLGIYDKNNSKAFDLSSILNLKSSMSLQMLDKFTMSFNDEVELKAYLLKKGIIDKNDCGKHFNIIYKFGGKIKKLPIIYSDVKKYIDDIMICRAEFKSLSSNIDYLDKLAKYYDSSLKSGYSPQSQNVFNIRYYLSEVNKIGGKAFYSDLLDSTLDNLFIKAVIRKDEKTGEDRYSYRGLRDLVAFIDRFETKAGLKNTVCNHNENNEYDFENSQLSLFESVEENVKTK